MYTYIGRCVWKTIHPKQEGLYCREASTYLPKSKSVCECILVNEREREIPKCQVSDRVGNTPTPPPLNRPICNFV